MKYAVVSPKWLLALVLSGIVLGFIALPVWFPWVVRPVLDRFDVGYEEYARSGYGRFVLRDVTFRNESFDFHAERIEGLLPLHWLWHRIRDDGQVVFLRVTGWSVRAQSPGEELEVAPAEPGPGMERDPSLRRAAQQARAQVPKAIKWLPRAAMEDGVVRAAGREFVLPAIRWEQGLLTGRVSSPDHEQTLIVEARVPDEFPWRVSAHLRPFGAEANVRITDENSFLRIEGELLWLTNRLVMEAYFPDEGWLPERAALDSGVWRVPAELLKLDGYSELRGELSARWADDRFNVELEARADPLENSERWFPVEILLGLAGDREAVHVERASAVSPWLTAGLSEELVVDYAGRMLSEHATLRIGVDLNEQPWVAVSGRLEGSALAQPGEGRIPVIALEFSGSAIESHGIKADRFEMDGQLAWPLLSVRSAQVSFEEASAEASMEIDLRARRLEQGSVRLDGHLAGQFLPEGTTYEGLRFEAEASGPVSNLSHSGRAKVAGLATPKLAPLGIEVEWRGDARELDQFKGLLNASNSVLIASGSAKSHPGPGGLRLEELTLIRDQEVIYKLAQPFSVSLERNAAAGKREAGTEWLLSMQRFEWQGNERSLALHSNVEWPSRGALSGTARNFEISVLSDFFREPLPALRIEALGMKCGWTNGPVLFEVDVLGQLAGETPLSGRVQARGGDAGMTLEQFQIISQSRPVISGRGFLPLRIEPQNQESLLQLDPDGKVDLRAESLPDRSFWNQVAEWTRIGLVDPKVNVAVSGPLAEPQGRISIEVAALRPELVWTNRELPRLEDVQIELVIDRAAVQMPNLSFLVEDQPVAAEGRIPLGKDFSDWRSFFGWQQATGVVQAAGIELAPFARFMQAYLSPQGVLDLNVALLPEAQFAGGLTLSNLATRPLPSVGSVQNVRAALKISGRQLDIQSFVGEIGGEPLVLTGKLDFDEINERTRLPLMDLRVRGERAPLARQPELILRSDLDVTVSNRTNDIPVVSGQVNLRDSIFLSDLSVLVPGRLAQPGRRPPYFTVGVAPFSDWQLNLQVTGDRFLTVRSPFFRGTISAGLRLDGNLREPISTGNVRVNSGVVQFPFANLDVTEGLVTLTSDDPYRPQLFITAASRTFGYDVRVEITGPADEPVIQFSSTPPLSSEQIILMLTTGNLPSQAAGMTAQQRAGRLAVFFGKNLLSEFLPGAGDGDRLTVRSGETLSAQGQQSYAVEYKLNENWSIVGEYDQFDALNVGLKWRIYSR
jgi:translocation and assembly module TamB